MQSNIGFVAGHGFDSPGKPPPCGDDGVEGKRSTAVRGKLKWARDCYFILPDFTFLDCFRTSSSPPELLPTFTSASHCLLPTSIPSIRALQTALCSAMPFRPL
ncbi:hypothetical protein ALUC_80076A [Aspergillus luchuensis]|nr:hypothetical protein ALUC_80076A [Aspergillus luchuensis]